MAHEDGLGVGRVEDIQVLGEDITHMNFRFSVGNNLAGRIGRLFWFTPLKKLQWLLFHTPLVYLFFSVLIFIMILYGDRLSGSE